MKLVILLLLTLLGLSPVSSHKCVEKMHRRSSISQILQVCGWSSVREWIVDFRKAIVLKISHHTEDGSNIEPATFESLSGPMNYYLELMNEWHSSRQIFTARLLVTAFGPNCRPFLSLPTLLQTPFLNAYMKEAVLTFDGTENYGILCPDALYFVRTISDGDILRPLKIKIHKLPLEEDSEYNQFVELHMKMHRRLALKQKKYSDKELSNFADFDIETSDIKGKFTGNSELKEKEAKAADKAFKNSVFKNLLREEIDGDQDLKNIGGILTNDDSDDDSDDASDADSESSFEFVSPSEMPPPKVLVGDVKKNQNIFMKEEIELLKKKRTLKEFFTYREGFKKSKRGFRLKDQLLWELKILSRDFDGKDTTKHIDLYEKNIEKLQKNIDLQNENRISKDFYNFFNTIRSKSDFDKGYFMKPDQTEHTLTGSAYKSNLEKLLKTEIKVNYQKAFKNHFPKHYNDGHYVDNIKINPHIETDFWTRLQEECDALKNAEDFRGSEIEPNFPTVEAFIKNEFYSFADKRAKNSDLLTMLDTNTKDINNLPQTDDKDEDKMTTKPKNIFKQQAEDIIKQERIENHNHDLHLGSLRSMGHWKNIKERVEELHEDASERLNRRKIFIDQKDIDKHPNTLTTPNVFLEELSSGIIKGINATPWDEKKTLNTDIVYDTTPYSEKRIHESMPIYEHERVDSALLSDNIEMHSISGVSEYEIYDRQRRYTRLNKPNKFYIRIKRDLHADIRALGEVGDAIASVMSLGSNQFCNGQSLEHCAGIQIFPDVIPISHLNQYTEQSLDEIFNEDTMFNNYFSSQVLRLCVFSQVHYMRLEKFVDYSIKRKELISLCYRSTQRTLATFNENHLQSSTFPRRWIIKNPYNTSAAKKALQKGMIDFEALKKVYQDEDDQLKLNSRVKIESLMDSKKKKEYQNEQSIIDDQIIKKQMDLLQGNGAEQVENRLALQRIKLRQQMRIMDTGYEQDRIKLERRKKMSKKKLRERYKKMKENRARRVRLHPPTFSHDISGVVSPSPSLDDNLSGVPSSPVTVLDEDIDLRNDTPKLHIKIPSPSTSSKHPTPPIPPTSPTHSSTHTVEINEFPDISSLVDTHSASSNHSTTHMSSQSLSGYGHDSSRYSEDYVEHEFDVSNPFKLSSDLANSSNFQNVIDRAARRQNESIIKHEIKKQRKVHWHSDDPHRGGHHGRHTRANTIISENFISEAGLRFTETQQVRKQKAEEFKNLKDLQNILSQDEDKNLINKGTYKFLPLKEALKKLRKVPNTKLIFRDGKLYRVPTQDTDMTSHHTQLSNSPTQLVVGMSAPPTTPIRIDNFNSPVTSTVLSTDMLSQPVRMSQQFEFGHMSDHNLDTQHTSVTQQDTDDDFEIENLITQITDYYKGNPAQKKRMKQGQGQGKEPYLVINQPINEYRNRGDEHLGQMGQVNPGDEELLNRSDIMIDLLKDEQAINMFDVALEKGVFTQDEDDDNIPIEDIFKQVYNKDFKNLDKDRAENKLLKDKDFTQSDSDMVQTMYNLARQTEYSENINHLLKFFAEYEDYEECMENVHNPEFLLEHSLNRNPYNNWVLRKDGVVYQVYDEMFFIPDNYELTHRPMKEWLFFPFSAICNGMLNHSFVTLGAIQQVSRDIAPNFEALNFRVRINEIDTLLENNELTYLFAPNSLVRKDEYGINRPRHKHARSVFIHDQSHMVGDANMFELAFQYPIEDPVLAKEKYALKSPTPFAFKIDEIDFEISISDHDDSTDTQSTVVSFDDDLLHSQPLHSSLTQTRESLTSKGSPKSDDGTIHLVLPSPPTIQIGSNHTSESGHITPTIQTLSTRKSQKVTFSTVQPIEHLFTPYPDSNEDHPIHFQEHRYISHMPRQKIHKRSRNHHITQEHFLKKQEQAEKDSLQFHAIFERLDSSMMLDDSSDDMSTEIHNPYNRVIIDKRYTTGLCKFLSDFECAAIYFNKLREKAKGLGEEHLDDDEYINKQKTIAYAAQKRIDLLKRSLQIGNCDSIAESAFENFGIMMIRIAEHSQKFGIGEELVINEPFVLDTISKFLPRSIESFFERHCISITMSKMEGILNRQEPNFARIKDSPFRKLGRVLLSRSKIDNPGLLDEITALNQHEQHIENFNKHLRQQILDGMHQGLQQTKLIEILGDGPQSNLLSGTGLGLNQDNIILFNDFFPDFTVTSFMNRAITFYQDISMYFFRNMDIGDLEDGVQD